MTKEQVYKAQLQELGVYEKAFDPLIKDLAQAERQRSRAQKEWSEKAKAEAREKGRDEAKAKPSFSDELWPVICALDKKILRYRESMGLTPKALRRLRGVSAGPAGPTNGELIAEKLDRLLESEDHGAWSYEDMLGAVSKMDTSPESPTGCAGAPFRQGGRDKTEMTDDAAD